MPCNAIEWWSKIVSADVTDLSESVQMYLVTIARLREGNKPVPLSQVANALSVSPVSVNEMCRKLEDQGLLVYQPYKGASLTTEGERRAHYILRRHRLWEVFLVEKLGLDYQQAHEAACQLEHSTPDEVADRLETFLGNPSANPEGLAIPRANGRLPLRELTPLSEMAAGEHGHVVRVAVQNAGKAFLLGHGVSPGAPFTILAAGDEGMLLHIAGSSVSLSKDLAEAVTAERGLSPQLP
jgi:DtxR family Mn-dependent transcriptional regulator